MSPLDVETSGLGTAALADPEQRRLESEVRRCCARLICRRIDDLLLRVDAEVAACGNLQIHVRRPGSSTRTQSRRHRAASWTASRRSTPSDRARPAYPQPTKRSRHSRTSGTSEHTR